MEDFWYGMEENYQYHGIWKNRLPFHSIPCPDLRNTPYNLTTDHTIASSLVHVLM